MAKKQYKYKDDFEMLMVRHEFLSKVKNVDPIWNEKFKSTVNITASIMYSKLRHNFEKVGYDVGDIVSIANCYMIGYMGLYSIERNEKVRQKIVESFKTRLDREPTQQELDRKERINLMSFLRQKI